VRNEKERRNAELGDICVDGLELGRIRSNLSSAGMGQMRILSERGEEERVNAAIMGVRECQKAIDSACKKLGLVRITHHDLRHLFATRCIESGVDIPTVSRWLGHKDGGALAMRTYGHLRDQHSAAMAQKVTFADSPSSQS
jgi:integrase